MPQFWRTILALLAALTPFSALHAQSFTYVSGGLAQVVALLGQVAPLLAGIALIAFIWNVIKFMRAGKEGTQSDAKGGVLWSLIALFVFVSVWGFVKMLQDTFKVDGDIGSLKPPAPLR